MLPRRVRPALEARLVYLYVDGVQVGTLFTRWPLKRILARLRFYNPKAQSLEVTLEPKVPVELKPSGNNALPTIAQDRRSASPASDSTLPETGQPSEWRKAYRIPEQERWKEKPHNG